MSEKKEAPPIGGASRNSCGGCFRDPLRVSCNQTQFRDPLTPVERRLDLDGARPDQPSGRGDCESLRDPPDVAASGSKRRRSLRQLAFVAVQATGSHGLTAHETTVALHREASVQPRLSELHRAGIIKDSGQRRSNLSGRRAIVWIASVAEAGG